MSECYIQDADRTAQHACDDCGAVFSGADLGMIHDIQERLTPNAPVPSGECPECGSLAYQLEEGETADAICMPRIDVNSLSVRNALIRHREGYGEESVEQAFHIATEEMGELLTAMNHFRRGRVHKENVLEEVGDVMLSCRMIANLLYGEPAVERTINLKAARFQPGRGGLGQRIKLSDIRR